MMRKCKKFLLILLSLVVLSCAVVACEKDDLSIKMSKSEATLEVGNTLQLELTINGLDKALLKWSSSSQENATVSESGLVTAVKKGSCIITATIGEYKADCALTVIDAPVTYTIEGAKDLAIKAGDAEYDFLNGVTAVGNDGSVATPSVDTSKIDFAKFGTYEIEYSFAGATSVKKNVKVFTPPTITVEAGSESIALAYSEATGAKVYSGLSAKDCYGDALEVKLLTSENVGYLSADGSANYGTHELTYFVVDGANNIVKLKRNLTVNEDSAKNPVFTVTAISEDVTTFKTDIALDVKGEDLQMISLNGVPFDNSSYEFKNNLLSLDVKDLFSTIELGTYNFRVVTSGGYKDIDFSVVDETPIDIDTYGMNNWWYEVGKTCALPIPVKENQNQRFVFKNTLVDASNASVAISDNKFVAATTGKYKYTINAVKNGAIAWHKDLELTVFSSEEFDTVFDLGTSTQRLGERIFMPTNVKVGTTFEYCETPLAGADSYYKYQIPANPAGNEWQHRLHFKDTEAHVKQYYSWTMDMYVSEPLRFRFWNIGNENWMSFFKDKCLIKDYTTGEVLDNMPAKQWFKLEIIINRSGSKPGQEPLWMGTMQKNAMVCFKNIRFDVGSDIPNTYGLNNWRYKLGEAGVLPVPNVEKAEHGYTFQYTLKDASNTPVTVTNGTFTPTTLGKYSYTVKAVKGDEVIWTKNLELTVYSAEEFDKIFDLGTSTQELGKRVYRPAIVGGVVDGSTLDYCETPLDGENSYYKYQIPEKSTATSEWPHRICFKDTEAHVKQYYKWTMDMYVSEALLIRFWNIGNDGWMSNLKDKCVIKDYNTGEVLQSMPAEQWFKIEIIINQSGASGKNDPLLMGTMHKNATVCFKNIRFESDIDYSIKMNKSEATIRVGATLQLEPTLTGLDNTLLKWSSSSQEIATVGDGGLVTGVKKGSCEITATVGEYNAKCVITVIDTPITYTIEGAKDLSIKAGDTEFDFLDGVTAVERAGSIAIPDVDTSKIDFAHAGTYEIEYSFIGAESVKKNVKVFTPPTITVEAGSESIALAYSEAKGAKIYSGIIAKDCFENILEVKLATAECVGYLSADGSANYGTHVLTYYVTDAANNIVKVTRSLTVNEDIAKNPVFTVTAISEDVSKYKIDIALDIKGEDLQIVSLNGVPFDNVAYEFKNNVLSIDVKDLFSTIELGAYNFRVVTSGGYKDIEFSVADNIEPIVNTYGMNNWWYEVGKNCDLPIPAKGNQNQRFTFQNTLVDSSNAPVAISENKFVATTIGKYKYTVNAVRNGAVAWTKDLELNVFSAEEFDRVFDLGTSTQRLGERIFMPTNVKVGTKFEYCETPLAGADSYYKYQIPANPAGNEWQHRLHFKDTETHVKKFYKWTMDMHVSEALVFRFWNIGNENWMSNFKDKCVIKDFSTGEVLDSMPAGKWFKLEIIINQSGSKPLQEPLWMGTMHKNATVCFKNIRFNIGSDIPSTYGLNNWRYKVGELGVLPVPKVEKAEHGYTFQYTLKDASSAPVTVTNGEFTPTTLGEYSYTVKAVKGDAVKWTKDLKLTVFSAEEFDKIFDLGTSTQELGKSIYRPAIVGGVVDGSTLDYCETPLAGENSYYKYQLPEKVGSSEYPHRICFKDTEAHVKKFYKWTMDMYVSEALIFRFWNIGDENWMSYYKDKCVIKDFTTGEVLDNMPAGKWFKLEIIINQSGSKPAQEPLWMGTMQKNATVCFKNIRFDVASDIPNTYGLNNWRYKVGEAGVLPVPKVEKAEHGYTYQYILKDASNAPVTVTNGTFTPTTLGKYSYTVKAVKGDAVIWTKNLELTVYSAEEFDKIFDLGTSTQELGKRIFVPKAAPNGTTLDYCETPLDGENSYYKYQIRETTAKNEWTHRICFNDKEARVKKYEKWTMDMYVSEAVKIRFWNNGDAECFPTSKGKCVIKDYTTGEVLDEMPAGKWCKIEIIINKPEKDTIPESLRFGTMQKNTTICFKNVRFA